METLEMVYSACVEWLDDWLEAHPVTMVDEWDLNAWMDNDMHEATQIFIEYAFHSHRARNDAIMILRALYYEQFLYNQECARAALVPNQHAVDRLPHVQQSIQKSAAWHAESRDMLSGHEFGGVAVGSVAERTAIIAKKCAPPDVIVEDATTGESRTVYVTPAEGLSAFKWGWRYEPVARQLFEICVAEAPVFDGLGRVRHPSLPRLGASPDGLIMSGPRCGRLVEIKCPISRELNGKIPVRYYCQMQLQAEVCDVEAVEYVEVQLAVARAESDIYASKQPWIGKVCVTAAAQDTPPELYAYEYSPLFPNTADGWRDVHAWQPAGAACFEASVWYVKDWFTTTVMRNRRWWNDVGLPAYKQLWVDIDNARTMGTYAPKPLFIDDSSE